MWTLTSLVVGSNPVHDNTWDSLRACSQMILADYLDFSFKLFELFFWDIRVSPLS